MDESASNGLGLHPGSEEILQSFASHPYQSLDADGMIAAVNDAWLDCLGYEREDIIGRWYGDILTNDSRKTFEARFDEFKSSGGASNVEFEITRSDGDMVIVSFDGVIEYDDQGNFVRTHCQFKDITGQKERERKLDESNTVLRTAVENMPMGVLVEDADRDILMTNERLPQLLAVPLSADDLIGRDCAEAAENLKDLFADPAGFVNGIDHRISRREPVHNEELELANGRVLERDYIPYVLPDGPANLWIYRDVTERKEREQQIEGQRDNLEVLNQVVRHDIRNDLQLVLAYAETLEQYIEEGGEEYLQQVLEAARDAVDITTTARDITKILLQQDMDRSPTRLRKALQKEIEDARSSNEQALVTVRGTIPDVEVLADDMLESVFRNLLTNAVIHNDTDIPEITVSVRTTDEVARIRFADNGPGIPDDQKERIFEESETGIDSEGTGLGLYLVRTIVGRYEGDVWIEDNDPVGSVFVVELPTVN